MNCLLPVLHPQHKLQYFRQAGWTSEWIDTAEALVRDKFKRSYMSTPNFNSDGEDSDGEAESDEGGDNKAVAEQQKVCSNFLFSLFSDFHRRLQESENIFDNLPALKKPSKSKALLDELRLYLSTPPEITDLPLRWWYEKRQTFPRLHRMALDYLSIPGMFVNLMLRFVYC